MNTHKLALAIIAMQRSLLAMKEIAIDDIEAQMEEVEESLDEFSREEIEDFYRTALINWNLVLNERDEAIAAIKRWHADPDNPDAVNDLVELAEEYHFDDDE